MDKLWYLSQVNMLNLLPANDLKEIAQMTSMKTIDKGTLIISPDKQEEILYILKKGRVRIYKINRDGKEFTLGILGHGNIFGELETLTMGSNNLYVEAMEELLICTLTKSDFEKLIENKPKFAYQFIQNLSNRLKDAHEMMENLANSSVKKRLIYLLHKLSTTFGIQDEDGWTHLDLPLSHQDIANMIGSTRETVSSTLKCLSKENIVKKGRKSIYIKDALIQHFV